MALVTLVLLACANLGAAVRLVNTDVVDMSLQLPSRPEKFAQRFCLSSEAHLACDDKSKISVYSAFYNRRKDPSCGPELVTNETIESCAPNFTSAILSPCNGKRECSLPPSMHPHCSTQPFRNSRIVWYCKPDPNASNIADIPPLEEEVELGVEVEDEEVEEEELPTLPELTTTTTSDVHIENVVTGQKVGKSKVMFCTSQPVKMTCPEGYGIDLYSAFYNTRKRDSCEAYQNPACLEDDALAPTCDCGTNATDLVLDKCARGVPSCVLWPDSHRFCKEMPFTFMRVVWDCVKGLEYFRVVQSDSVVE